MLKALGLASLALAASVVAQLPPGVSKIRGVNLGSWLLVEPYMMQDYWDNHMSAWGACSEWDYVKAKGQAASNTAFREHWDTFITQKDVALMKQYGLNTVRIPIGFWIVESTKIAGLDYYPEGGMTYLTRGLGWLRDAGIAVLLDIHAVPGASTPNNAFAGKCTGTPAFWANKDRNFDRAADAIRNLTTMAHTNPSWSSVYAIQMLNEPPMEVSQTPGYGDYLKKATAAVRDTEKSLGVSKQLTLSYMDYNWQYGSGTHANPADAAAGKGPALYDNHLYYSFGGLINNNAAVDYIANVCNTGPERVRADGSVSNTPLVFGEWWLAERPGCANCDWQFHRDFADAQKIAYERGAGWIFWAWSFRGTDQYRSYKDAVAAGFFSADATVKFNPNVCKPYLAPANQRRAALDAPAPRQSARPASAGWRAPESVANITVAL
ncbi:glycoside hydrolase family 5 protein [Botryobasidium botryosum FD-172 SS1]|uniref:glucan 1,3-beta-glucosidase n=1 Tax=Botryobasidium botryosum (strain FD-172 SS1) TaxID=930990 RepID=A0A067M0K7_BOTB1|nr:glycoside hydrolase family 5 protein [Botryobasidium botryosum FD-172 SS1]